MPSSVFICMSASWLALPIRMLLKERMSSAHAVTYPRAGVGAAWWGAAWVGGGSVGGGQRGWGARPAWALHEHRGPPRPMRAGRAARLAGVLRGGVGGGIGRTCVSAVTVAARGALCSSASSPGERVCRRVIRGCSTTKGARSWWWVAWWGVAWRGVPRAKACSMRGACSAPKAMPFLAFITVPLPSMWMSHTPEGRGARGGACVAA